MSQLSVKCVMLDKGPMSPTPSPAARRPPDPDWASTRTRRRRSCGRCEGGDRSAPASRPTSSPSPALPCGAEALRATSSSGGAGANMPMPSSPVPKQSQHSRLRDDVGPGDAGRGRHEWPRRMPVPPWKSTVILEPSGRSITFGTLVHVRFPAVMKPARKKPKPPPEPVVGAGPGRGDECQGRRDVEEAEGRCPRSPRPRM